MRAVSKPQFDTQLVYEACVNSISNDDLRNRLNSIANHIVKAGKDYDLKAQVSTLFKIELNNCENIQIVVGAVTKQELKDVYTQHMVGLTKPARRIYDELIEAAPNGKCPSCGFGQASTLDHYLPKTKFPCLSVLPINLVPACKDCNTGKSASLAVIAERQTIHPYYDSHHGFFSEQWLFAEVKETNPVSIKFYVEPPEDWMNIPKQRVITHFKNFDLSRRFSVEAAEELSSLNPLLFEYFAMGGKGAVKFDLETKARVEFKNHKNSWKTAMYQALASSDWYCEYGFR
jgi:hypothetical protein